MTPKEFILSRLQLFFFLTTLILLVSAIIGTIFVPEQELHYYQLFFPFVMAGLCVLPTCVMYFRKEPTRKQYIFRCVIAWLLIEGIMLAIITPPENSSNDLAFYGLIGGVVLVIYVLAILMMWLQKYRQAKMLMVQLKALQKNG